MTTQLNLLASEPGNFAGLSAQFSGDGFSDMRFEVRAVSEEDFKAWLASAHANTEQLDATRYTQLAAPSQRVEPAIFGQVSTGLFEDIVHNHGSPVVSGRASSL
jgi:cytochrome o ubiquinol oxidase subunit 2